MRSVFFGARNSVKQKKSDQQSDKYNEPQTGSFFPSIKARLQLSVFGFSYCCVMLV